MCAQAGTGSLEVDVSPQVLRTASWRLTADQLTRGLLPPEEQNYDTGNCPDGFHACMPGWKKKRVDGYYRRQYTMLQNFLEADALAEGGRPTSTAEADSLERAERGGRRAVTASNIANIILLFLKIFASIESKSLAIIASTLDSLLDCLSGFILWFTMRTMRQANPYKYPIGKQRMQPLGIIVFASIMATLGLQILLEGGRDIMSSDGTFKLEQPVWIISIMVTVTMVKLVLFLICKLYKDEIVQAYAKDHFFDVVTNVLGLAAALLANSFEWWIDPVGAILLATYTIVNWSGTVLENVRSLTGMTAPPEYLQLLTYICWNHHQKILQIDTVRAYTFGSHYFCEVDVVLPGDMPLKEAHDIGEALQYKLEALPEIERAFVHLDFEVSHRPEHGLLQTPQSIPSPGTPLPEP